MKISLITYHYSNNKGAFMQTYALCRYLKELGHEVQIVDIRQDEGTNLGLLGRIAKELIVGYRLKKDMHTLYPPLTRRYDTIEDLQKDPPVSDCYIVGSDQTWNPDISGKCMMAYFLDFGDDKVRRMSYASSFGKAEWSGSEGVTEHIKQLLHSYYAISVREQQGADICKDVFDINPTVVLDPTFLNLEYPEFNKGIKQSNDFLCYKLNRTTDFWQNVGKVGEIISSKPILLNYNYPKRGFRYCFPPSLRTWMRKFAKAKFILTDSFHGIAFSLINRKQFVAILNSDGKNSRLINLMKTVGLEDRLYPSVESLLNDQKWRNPIDYNGVEKLLLPEIEKSREFLKQALK